MDLIEFIRDLYGGKQSVGLHEPLFIGNELTNVQSAIQSSYVSSVGKFVD